MKKLSSIIFILVIGISTLIAQTSAPKKITEKYTKMKDQIKTDLQLTDVEATSFYNIMVEKSVKDAEQLKTLETPEAKKEYRQNANKEFIKKLKESFGAEKGMAIKKWISDNQANFNKKKAEK